MPKIPSIRPSLEARKAAARKAARKGPRTGFRMRAAFTAEQWAEILRKTEVAHPPFDHPRAMEALRARKLHRNAPQPEEEPAPAPAPAPALPLLPDEEEERCPELAPPATPRLGFISVEEEEDEVPSFKLAAHEPLPPLCSLFGSEFERSKPALDAAQEHVFRLHRKAAELEEKIFRHRQMRIFDYEFPNRPAELAERLGAAIKAGNVDLADSVAGALCSTVYFQTTSAIADFERELAGVNRAIAILMGVFQNL